MLENGDKFETLQYGLNESLKEDYDYMTPDCVSYIPKVSSVRDLGIIVSNNCEFNLQITTIIAKVRKTLGWIKRSFISCEANFMQFLWATYCLPYLDFGSQLWMPTGTPLMKNVESLQFSFMKSLPIFQRDETNIYWKMLKIMRLYSIERRTERFKILYTWKVFEHLAPNYGIVMRESVSAGRLCDVSPLITGFPESVKNIRLCSLQHVGPCLWNSLPAELRAVTQVNTDTFKHKLDQYLSFLPDTPWLKGHIPEARHPLSGLPSNSVIHLARIHFGATRRL
jgi:hypothetical protein